MFPNVRLVIAATVASVVALICGFGLFAAFRVSHEPLVRLPPAVAPIQLVADNAARLSTTVAAAEPFDRRFQISAAPNIHENVSSPARGPDLHDDVEFTPGGPLVAPAAGAPAAPDARTASVEPEDAAAPPALQPAEAPAAAEDSATNPAPMSEPPVPPPETGSATASNDADRALPAPTTVLAEAEQETKASVAPGPSIEPAAAPGIAAIEPERDWRRFSTDPLQPTANESTNKKTKRIRTALRPRRVGVIARAETFPAVADQSAAFGQSYTVPRAQTQFVARPAVRIRPAKIAAGRSKATNSAIGGPFVSAPSR